jgi:heat shock protein HslJ
VVGTAAARRPSPRPARLAAGLAALALAGSLGGCSALVPNPWIGGWLLRTYGGKPAAAQATLSFSQTDAVFQTGCNQGAGGYTYQSPVLTFSDVAFTLRACPDPATAAQDKAIRAVASGQPVRMSAGDKEMTIDPGGGGAVLVFDRTSGA